MIGVFGGTFDPIHNGHLAVAKAALAQSRLDLVLIMPAGEPWQKSDRHVTDASHRLEMVRLAAAEVPGLEVDDRELLRPGPTFTIDTLESFSSEHELFLVLGADSAVGLPTWHRAQDVMRRATVMVVPRPGWDPERVLEIVPGAVVLEMGPVDVSATMIRDRIGAGDDVDGMIPPAVAEYAVANHLYTQGAEPDRVEPTTDMEDQS